MLELKQERIALQKSMLELPTAADIISLLNASFGFLAVMVLCLDEVSSVDFRLHVSFSLILLALLADGLDGIIARKRGKGALGEYLEAMADMISMGIAPAVFIYTRYQDVIGENWGFIVTFIIVLLFFLLLGVMRLASFHVMKQQEVFIGLPASAATIIVLTVSYLKIEVLYVIISLFVVAVLMVSHVSFPKLKAKLNAIAAVIIFLTMIYGNQYNGTFLYFLLTAILIYVIGGPLFLIKKGKNKRKYRKIAAH